jgi:hypothetical protein
MSTQVYNERIMLKNVYGMRRVFILSALCILIVLSCFQLGGRAQAQEEYRKNYGDAVDFGFKPINVHGCVGRTSPNITDSRWNGLVGDSQYILGYSGTFHPADGTYIYYATCLKNTDGLPVEDWDPLIVNPVPPPVVPPAPQPSAVCNALGSSAFMSWTGVGAATSYQVEVVKPSSELCPSGWSTSGNTCMTRTGSPMVTFPTQPGTNYSWLVYSRTATVLSDQPTAGNSFSCTPPAANNPIGDLNSVDCNNIVGWTCDADNFNQALNVDLYRDGAFGAGGTYIGTGVANITREAAVGAMCGGNTAHGFSIATPASVKDGAPHQIYAHGINIGGGTSINALGAKSLQINCAAPTVDACGTANTVDTLAQPSSNLCSGGALSWSDTTAGDGTYNWSCGSMSCSARKMIPGACNPSAARNYTATETTYDGALCSQGTPSSNPTFPTQGNSVSWTCGGTNGGTPSPVCTAAKAAAGATVGVCGLAHDAVYSDLFLIPDADFCNGGIANRYNVDAADLRWVGPSSYYTGVSWMCKGSPDIPANSSGKCSAWRTPSLCGDFNGVQTAAMPVDRAGYATGFCRVGVPINKVENATNFTWQCLQPGSYKFYTSNGISNGFSSVSCSAPKNAGGPMTPPSDPTNFTAFTGGSCGGQITLSWTPSAGADSYEVSANGRVSWIPVPGGSAATSYTLTGLSPSLYYGSLYVRARNASGLTSNPVGPVIAESSPACPAGPVSGVCGLANGSTRSTRPTSNECASGNLYFTDGSANDGTYNWDCQGSGGGTTASCSATYSAGPLVNGACGSANGVTVSSMPWVNNCSAGSLTTNDTSGTDGDFNWSCVGSGGGVTGRCSAPYVFGAQADLVVTDFNPSAGPYTQNTGIQLTGSFRNAGSVSTGASFYNDFTYRWDTTGMWQNFAGGNGLSHGALAAGAPGSDGPVTFTPNQTGSLYIQYCLDSNHYIPEGSEANCMVKGPYTVGSGSTPQPPVATSISFSNNGPISYGSNAVLSYTVTGWDLCQIARVPQNSNLGGTFNGNIGSGASNSDFGLTANQIYRLSCWIAATGQRDSRDTTVVVNPAATGVNLTSMYDPAVASGSLLPNQTVTFRDEVRNTGAANISTQFYDSFKYCWGSGCSPTTQIGTDISEGPLTGSGGSRIDVSAGLLLTNTGWMTVMHCVDSTSVIPESNESDNCRAKIFWVGYMCVGNTPTQANWCPGNEVGLTRDTQKNLVDTCTVNKVTDAHKCEFECITGYRRDATGRACELIPVCMKRNMYDATLIPTDTAFYPGDDQGLLTSDVVNYSSSGTDGRKCEFYCVNGGTFNGTSCQLDCPIGTRWNDVTLQCENITTDPAACSPTPGLCLWGSQGSTMAVYNNGGNIGLPGLSQVGWEWTCRVRGLPDKTCFAPFGSPSISLQVANPRPTTLSTTLTWSSTLDPQNCKLYVEDPMGSSQTYLGDVPNVSTGYQTDQNTHPIIQPMKYTISCDGGVTDSVDIAPGVRSYARTVPAGGSSPIGSSFDVVLDAHYADICWVRNNYRSFATSGFEQIQSGIKGWTKTVETTGLGVSYDRYTFNSGVTPVGSDGTYTWSFQCTGDHGGSAASVPPSVTMVVGNGGVVLPQCSNLGDDDGDTRIDAADPGCHSDGNPANAASYVASDNDETDGAVGLPDLVITNFNITTSAPYPVNGTINFTGQASNAGADGPSTVFSNNFTYQLNGTGGWQPIASLPHGGGQPLLSGTVFNDAASYRPTQNGILRIQYCVDSNPAAGVINEGPTGEANNCVTSGPLTIGTGIPTGGPQCSNGSDDGDPEDTLIDMADPGCTDATDDDESDGGPSNSCTGVQPANTSAICAGDDTGVSGSVLRTAVSYNGCTAAAKCEYPCAVGYVKSGNACVPANITTFEVCDANGTSNCVSSGGTKNVDAGTTLLVRWSASNATRCDAVSGTQFSTGGAVNGTDPATAPATANVNELYTIACGNGGQVSDTETVTIHTNPAGPTLTVNPRVVRARDTDDDRKVTVTWDTNNGNEALCTLVQTGSATNLLIPGGDPEQGSYLSQPINSRTTFTLTCQGLPPVSRTVEYSTSLIET